MRDPDSISRGILMWNRDSPVSVVLLHWWPQRVWLLRPCGFGPEPSLGCCAENVMIPLDLKQLFCPGYTLAAGPPSSFTTDIVGCWGGRGVLWRACNLTVFTPCLTGPVDYPFASIMRDPNSILLALSHYSLFDALTGKIVSRCKKNMRRHERNIYLYVGSNYG